jgi:membrane-associated protein
LNFYFALCFVLLGGLSKTLIGYSLGKFLYKRFNYNKYFKYVQKRVYRILPGFKTKPFWSIFISKFIMGANHLVIIFCGFERIDYKKFLKAEISSTIIWAPLMLSLGYFFSYTALRVSHNIWKFLIVVLILFTIFVIFDKLVSWLYELFEEFYYEHS